MHETLYSCFVHFVVCRPYSGFKMGRWSYWLFTSLRIYVFDMDCYLFPSLRYAEFMSLAFALEYVYVCVNITYACFLSWTWCPLGKTQLTAWASQENVVHLKKSSSSPHGNSEVRNVCLQFYMGAILSLDITQHLTVTAASFPKIKVRN